MTINIVRQWFLIIMILTVTSCGYHLRGSIPLAAPLHKLYLETSDPYGQLTQYLKQYLKVSGVTLVGKPVDSRTILVVLNEATSQQLLGISGNQQTRQYNLILTVTFQITNPQGAILVPPQIIRETRSFTIKSDQILAGSNEASNLYDQMRLAIVYNMMSRLGSTDISNLLTRTPLAKP